MKKILAVLLCISCLFTFAYAEDETIEATVVLSRNRFTGTDTVDAKLTIRALKSIEGTIILLDNSNQTIKETEIALKKDEIVELDIKVPIDDSAVKHKKLTIKIKYPVILKREVYYKNYIVKVPIQIVPENMLNDLEIVLQSLPDVIIQGEALHLPVSIANRGTLPSENIVLHYNNKSLSIEKLLPGQSADLELDFGTITEDLALQFALEYSQDKEKKTINIDGKTIHVGFPYIKFGPRRK